MDSGEHVGFDWTIGLIVKLKLINGDVVEGEIFGHDAATSCVVLAQTLHHTLSKKNYRVIKISFVKEVQEIGKIGASDLLDLSELPPVDFKQVQKREEIAILKHQEEANRIGEGVTPEAQAIFNHLQKTMPCRWDRDSIIVLDQLIIKSPYGRADCACNDAKVLDRVRTVLANVPGRPGRGTSK